MHISPHRAALALVSLALLCGGCGKDSGGTVEDFRYRWVTFPDGARYRAELAVRPEDQLRGLKFRELLAADQAMLFIHHSEGYYPYWMHEVKIPLDIIWLDKNRRIVQIVHGAPPCHSEPSLCPNYGGGFFARFVLEVNAGVADKHKLAPGMALEFNY